MRRFTANRDPDDRRRYECSRLCAPQGIAASCGGQWPHARSRRGTKPLGDSLAGTTEADYTDGGAAGDTGTNYYYTVKAVGGGGLKSGESNQVGEYDCVLTNVLPE